MKSKSFLALLLLGVTLSGCTSLVLIPWPPWASTLEPGVSTSTVKVVLPSVIQVSSPPSGPAASRAIWLGLWTGWACAEKECDIALLVEHVTESSATITYFTANDFQKPARYRLQVHFGGDEIHGQVPNGPILAFRMRTPDVAEMYWHRPPFNTRIGVLSRAGNAPQKMLDSK